MLVLDYTAEKENTLVSVQDRLMLNESQINHLLDSLVANGFDIVSTWIREEN
jgi:DNA-binding IclR family transcriptional regulator